jgi:AraC-like DNA-binding protein
MMPLADGYEVCSTLHADKRTNHIPVVLLTAKTAMESRLTGLKSGAVDYLNKPFSKEELMLRLRNILSLKRSIGENYKRKMESIRIAEPAPKPANLKVEVTKEPVSKLEAEMEAVLEKQLENGAFDVTLFCSEMNMSRTQLHRKVKAITGLSTTQFIRSYRLKASVEILQKGDKNVAETAYAVGFNDPGYFTKCFTEQFGLSPAKVIKSKA